MFIESDLKKASELLESIQFFSHKGWSPATSTNYSVRASHPEKIIISRSGIDKSKFTLNDFISIDLGGKILAPYNRPGMASSAETEIHTALYNRFPEINCVLHTHSVLGTVLSKTFQADGSLHFEGWEILKGLAGNSTHEMNETLPIVPNSQVMAEIISSLTTHLKEPLRIHGFLIAGHGLYTWGKDVATAKRHIETFEFLFECTHHTRRI